MSYFKYSDIFWWHSKVQLQTGIVDLYIANENKQGHQKIIKEFTSPNTIVFEKVNEGPEMKITTIVNQVPLNFDRWIPEILEKCISIIKFVIDPDEMLYVEFADLGTTTLKAMIKEDYRPTVEELENAATIDSNQTVIQHFFDILLTRPMTLYLGFIVQKSTVEQHIISKNMHAKRRIEKNKRRIINKSEYQENFFTTNVHLRFRNIRCMSWLNLPRKWASGNCKVKENLLKSILVFR